MAKNIINLQYTPNLAIICFTIKQKPFVPKKNIFAQNGVNIDKFHMFNLQVDEISSFDFMGKTIFLVKKGIPIGSK